MTKEQDKAYIQYGMARFGAYANVMPVLGNEIEQKATLKHAESEYNLESHQWCNKMGEYLKKLAVFGLPVTVHNPMESFAATNPGFYALLRQWPFPWTSCMLRQMQVGALSAAEDIDGNVPENTSPIFNMRGYARHNQLLTELRKYGIPIINEEPGYEMAGYVDSGLYNPKSWNSQNPNTIIATFWTALTAGAYAMWGSFDTYELGNPLPGIKRTITPSYLKILHDFITELPYWEMEPANHFVSANEVTIEGKGYRSNFCLAKDKEAYLVFSFEGGDIEINLAQGNNYEVTQLNPRKGLKEVIGQVPGGKQRVSIVQREQVILFRKV